MRGICVLCVCERECVLGVVKYFRGRISVEWSDRYKNRDVQDNLRDTEFKLLVSVK